MRILIIGDFSSFSKNLSAGFQAIGHECFVFSWGDGFKKIKQDENAYMNITKKVPEYIPQPFSNFLSRYYHYCAYLRLKSFVSKMSKGEKWDVALLISINFIKYKYWHSLFTREMLESLLKDHSKIFLSACGSDVPVYDYWGKHKWKNQPLVALNKDKFLNCEDLNHFKNCASYIHHVIPVMFDYAEAWRKSQYAKSFVVHPTIPLPVDTASYQPENVIKDRIVVFHGIIRPEAKGTKYIVEAMDRLQEKYPDKVECIAKGGMPLNEYLPLLHRTNILIDQTYAGSSGMNALYALAMGKVLLGGNEPENSVEYNYPEIPIVNIIADSNQIFAALEKLILNPSEIIRLSRVGREYVERVHDSKRVANMYIKTFNNEIA